MVWVGIDAHKKVLVAVAVDDAGQEVSSWRAHNRTSDWQDCSDWIKGIRGVSAVGIEGAYSYGRGLAQWLVGQTFIVYDVNPRWTAGYRKTARRQHKTDPLDARAVASVVRRDAPDLPQVHADDVSSLLQVMVSERDAAQSESVRLRNQLHDHFFQLGVELKALDATKLRKVLAQLPAPATPLDSQRLVAIERLAARCFLALADVSRYTTEIEAIAKEHFAPLVEIHGIGLLTAGVIASHLGPQARFVSEGQVAAYAGVAPIEVSSAGKDRHRLNRSGCRKLNAALYFIALSQYRSKSSPGCQYIERRRAEGRTLREAVRALKRYIARAVFRSWRECLPPQSAPVQLPS